MGFKKIFGDNFKTVCLNARVPKTLVVLGLVFHFFCTGQTIEYPKLKFQGLSFYSEKSTILSLLGNPLEIIEPHYECGALSSDWEGKDIFQLIFEDFVLTGNKTYLIEKIDFENNEQLKLDYGDYILSSKTSVEEAKEIFGDFQTRKSRSNTSHEEILLNGMFLLNGKPTLADDGVILIFRKGKLIRFKYWSSC